MNPIPADTGLKPNVKVATPPSKPEISEIRKRALTTDAERRGILYCTRGIKDGSPVSPDELKPIDLHKALEETFNLARVDHTKDKPKVSIVLYNPKNLDSIDIFRVNNDAWNLSAPVFCEDVRYCNKFLAHSDDGRVEETIKTFFEGGDWYGMNNFTFDHQMFEVECELWSSGFLDKYGNRHASSSTTDDIRD